MEIKTETKQGKVAVTVLRLQGNLDASSSDFFSGTTNQAIQNGAKDILVDLSGVEFMSSAGLRALHALYTQLHPVGSAEEKEVVYKGINAGTYEAPHLKLLKPSRKVEEVIKLAGLDMYLKSYQDEQQAIAAF
jgi:anti-anti-sigma factor